MKQIRSILLLLTALTLLSGCATFEEMQRRYEDNYRSTYCSYEGAYILGVNDAKDGDPMRTSAAKLCDADLRVDVKRGYREGYMDEERSRPSSISIDNSRTNTTVMPAARKMPSRTCHKSSSGEKICGYNCKQWQGRWFCGDTPAHTCRVINGKMRCQKGQAAARTGKVRH